MRLLFTCDQCFGPWTEYVFLTWGQHVLPDVLAEILDRELEIKIETEFYELNKILPHTECQDRLAFLKQKLAYTRAVLNRRNRSHTVHARQAQPTPSSGRLRSTRSRRCLSPRASGLTPSLQCSGARYHPQRPIYRALAGKPHFLIVHIFSGRRRQGDVHCFLQAWAQRKNVDITVLFMDTAISITYGDLSWRSASWTELLRCCEHGWVSATLAGTPCETFSEARFNQLEVEDSSPQRHMPRPLRSFWRLLGLPHLTKKELEQLYVGSCFFLQGLLLLALQVVQGGLFVSEHPAPPRDASRPSIWTSPWMSILRSHPYIALHTIPQ